VVNFERAPQILSRRPKPDVSVAPFVGDPGGRRLVRLMPWRGEERWCWIKNEVAIAYFRCVQAKRCQFGNAAFASEAWFLRVCGSIFAAVMRPD